MPEGNSPGLPENINGISDLGIATRIGCMEKQSQLYAVAPENSPILSAGSTPNSRTKNAVVRRGISWIGPNSFS